MVIILPKVFYHPYSNWGRNMMHATWKIDTNIWWVIVKWPQLLGSPSNVMVFKVRVFISSMRYCFFNNETQKILYWSVTDLKWYHRWPRLYFWWGNMYFLPFLPLKAQNGIFPNFTLSPRMKCKVWENAILGLLKGKNGEKCMLLKCKLCFLIVTPESLKWKQGI